MKKKVGRPKSDKIRVHIMIRPEVEKLAKKVGYTKFFDDLAKKYMGKK